MAEKLKFSRKESEKVDHTKWTETTVLHALKEKIDEICMMFINAQSLPAADVELDEKQQAQTNGIKKILVEKLNTIFELGSLTKFSCLNISDNSLISILDNSLIVILDNSLILRFRASSGTHPASGSSGSCKQKLGLKYFTQKYMCIKPMDITR